MCSHLHLHTCSHAVLRTLPQDQIHNSIVSTLLALMDGLDARGKVSCLAL